jgi:hypothetical protein
MTIAEYIEGVKAKLDEFSPFEEPMSFIAVGDADAAKVKPVVAYIEQELPNAVRYCLSILPQSLLSKDIEKNAASFTLNSDRVGVVESSEELDLSAQRLIRVRVPNYWKRDVTAFLKSEDAEYLIQQNANTRAGAYKPQVVYVAEDNALELYSFPYKLDGESAVDAEWDVDIWSINVEKSADGILSNVHDFVIIKCAQLVMDILGNANGSQSLDKEFQRKIEAL